MKSCSAPLSVREMQIKATIIYHLIPVRKAFIEKITANVMENVEKRDSYKLLVAMYIGTTMKTVEVSQIKKKNRITRHFSNSILHIYPFISK